MRLTSRVHTIRLPGQFTWIPLSSFRIPISTHNFRYISTTAINPTPPTVPAKGDETLTVGGTFVSSPVPSTNYSLNQQEIRQILNERYLLIRHMEQSGFRRILFACGLLIGTYKKTIITRKTNNTSSEKGEGEPIFFCGAVRTVWTPKGVRIRYNPFSSIILSNRNRKFITGSSYIFSSPWN